MRYNVTELLNKEGFYILLNEVSSSLLVDVIYTYETTCSHKIIFYLRIYHNRFRIHWRKTKNTVVTWVRFCNINIQYIYELHLVSKQCELKPTSNEDGITFKAKLGYKYV